jgi:hypothetical protein
MFAMLLGPWPRVTADGDRLDTLEAGVAVGRTDPADVAAAVERCVGDALDAQAAAGMGLLTDGGVRWADPVTAVLAAIRAGDLGADGMLVRAWRSAAGRVDLPVAQAFPGPWTLAVRDAGPDAGDGAVARRAGELADALAGELRVLAAAGCPVIQVMEPAAVHVGASDRARKGFARAHRRLLEEAGSLHAMLAVTGGSAAAAGADTIFGAPYASHAFDLIAGPDNWHLVRGAPGERGIVCAALRAGDGQERRDQSPELVWAAHYAASSNGRGLDRVGLANATPLDGLTAAEAAVALEALARAASFAAMTPDAAVAAGLDPRVVTHRPRPRP